jgi:hypothetical protein
MDDKDYVGLVANFASQNGFYYSCSNGIFTLSPQKITHETQTDKHQKEVEEFKNQNPMYKNAKGVSHQEPKTISYELKLTHDGNTIYNTLKIKKKLSRLNLDFLRHLSKNSYRFLKIKNLESKYAKQNAEEILNALNDLNLLEEKEEKIKLNEKGNKYVRKLIEFNTATRKSTEAN